MMHSLHPKNIHLWTDLYTECIYL